MKSQSRYWAGKITGNRARDRRHVRALLKAGWKVYVIWECELRKRKRLEAIAAQLLNRRRLSQM